MARKISLSNFYGGTSMSINSGDTAFMMLCTAMVCLMTPGLAFFYGGLARKRSMLFIMLESFISMGIVT